MITILAFAFVIGVLIFVHELGHFLAARRVGVRVLTFSVGFGPRLIGFTRNGTGFVGSLTRSTCLASPVVTLFWFSPSEWPVS